MIFSDFAKAVAQLTDRRFRRVLWLGLGLTLALLIGIYALFLWFIQTFASDPMSLPVIGEVEWIGTLLSVGSLLVMVALSVFLMVPVASAFSGLFLEDVAQAVEDRHYPTLPPVPRQSLGQTLIDTVNFFGLLVAVNLLAVLAYGFAGPLAPLIFWGVNGFLLGREYFQLAAMRRLGRAGAKALRRHHPFQIWFAGILMVLPLSIPLVNFLVPVLGAATFTHLFHRLWRQHPG
jgi:CysZ protein